LVFGETTEPIKKLATTLSISDELLEDAPSVQSYLNSRLALFVRTEEERQIFAVLALTS
jgi:HK97 family phage major capsid protein